MTLVASPVTPVKTGVQQRARPRVLENPCSP